MRTLAWPIAIAVAIGGLGVWLNLLTPSDGWWFWGALFLLLAAIVSQTWISVASVRSAKDARAEFKVLVYDQIAPLTYAVTLHAAKTPARRRADLKEVMITGVSCATGLTDADHARASVFRVDPDNGDALVPWPGVSAGRGDLPQSRFLRGTDEGDAVWELVSDGRSLFCRDTLTNPPLGWDSSRDRRYRTFITAPILRADRTVFGLLTVNAPKPNDLTDDDVGVLQVIAGLLASAVEMSEV